MSEIADWPAGAGRVDRRDRSPDHDGIPQLTVTVVNVPHYERLRLLLTVRGGFGGTAWTVLDDVRHDGVDMEPGEMRLRIDEVFPTEAGEVKRLLREWAADPAIQ